ncbi:MAG TPA: hypothetical protein VMX76_02130 [Nevskiaceae bacterium]|nr:hypothetical protein [Nevskiaceae bacterium]
MKRIVTHINPDLDAVASVWLIKQFLPGWEEAEIDFIASSISTEKKQEIDQNPNVLYVDVGRGKLDHHQTGKLLSAAQLCFDFIKKARKGKKLSPLDEEVLKRVVKVVTEVDNARDLSWQEVKQDRYKFYLHTLISGIRGLAGSDQEAMNFGLKAFNAVALNLKNKIRAEEELIKGGIRFETPWGQAIALESGNEEVLWEGETQGFCLVVKKDPETGAVRIYGHYDKGVDLTKAYNKFKKLDPQSDWFLHASKKLLLNQASVNPDMRPTKLKLEQIVKVLTS